MASIMAATTANITANTESHNFSINVRRDF